MPTNRFYCISLDVVSFLIEAKAAYHVFLVGPGSRKSKPSRGIHVFSFEDWSLVSLEYRFVVGGNNCKTIGINFSECIIEMGKTIRVDLTR